MTPNTNTDGKKPRAPTIVEDDRPSNVVSLDEYRAKWRPMKEALARLTEEDRALL